MTSFILRNVLKFVLLMLATSMVVFALVSVSPLDPVQMNVGQSAYLTMSPEKKAQLAEYWGTNAPLWERYGHWFGDVIRGDMGTSLRFNAPVADVIAGRFLNSLALMAAAWILSGILGFALGLVAAVKRGGIVDRIIKGYCLILAATPTFWLGLVFLIIFSVTLGWFPIGFSVPIGASAADVGFLDILRHLVLPATTLSVIGVANIALHTREKAIDTRESEFFRFAEARGASTWQAMRQHGLRNLLLPALTLQFAQVAELFGGSVLVEQVFSYPGLGSAAVTAGLGGDVALLAAIALISAALVFSGNLVANILYGVIDPRIRRRGFACAKKARKGAGDASS
ncbi:MAG: ABC transporter permease [Coriobacteriales bacterium]|jgi:peptide/nickel transport system permease protein|nr:ABC transporter permease [Coriobacteriales bacterium]